jgi:hypothetical protein
MIRFSGDRGVAAMTTIIIFLPRVRQLLFMPCFLQAILEPLCCAKRAFQTVVQQQRVSQRRGYKIGDRRRTSNGLRGNARTCVANTNQ